MFFDVPGSPEDCLARFNVSVNCQQPELGTFESNGDIAGPGVILSFMITISLTIIITLVLLALECCEYFLWRERWETKKDRENQDGWRRLLDAFLVSLSDQQIVTGLALSIVTLYGCACSISAYHYDLVCNLVLLSSAVHLCSITVLDKYFATWWLGGLRIITIIVSFVFGWGLFVKRAAKGFPSGPPSGAGSDNSTTALVVPAVCAMAGNVTALSDAADVTSRSAFYQYLVLTILFGLSCVLVVVAALYLTKDASVKAHISVYMCRAIFAVAVLIISIFTIAGTYSLKGWMSDSGWFSAEDDGEKTYKTFGQLVPLILLVLPGLAAAEALADKLEARKRRGEGDHAKDE